jgi:beta-barrel assembly-enhancing protease
MMLSLFKWGYLLLLFLLPVTNAHSDTPALPDIGTSADQVLSLHEEAQIGREFMRKLRQSGMLLDDPAVDSYLNHLGYKLVAHSDTPTQKFTFFAIKDNSINAFAVPGGYIGLNSGLLLRARRESELAAVMAHEIAHVTQRHIARMTEGQGKLSLPMIAAMIAAAALGATTNNPELAHAAIATLSAGSIQMQIDFTRHHEKEADRVGMQILAGAGFDPRSMADFFMQLQNASRYYDGAYPDFLRTHPVTTDRIAETRERAERYEPMAQPQENALFHLMRAQVLTQSRDNPTQLFKELESALAQGHYQDERALRYGLVMSALAAQRPQEVHPHLTWLRTHDGERVLYHIAAMRLAKLEQNETQALEIGAHAYTLYPGDRLLALSYARLLLDKPDNERATRARQVLESAPHTDLPDYHRLLAQAQHASGQTLEALLSTSEAYYLQGNTAHAISQLSQAAKTPHLDFYLAARIEARLSELKAIHLEEMKIEKR